MTGAGARLGPPDKRDALLARPGQVFRFIVTPEPGASPALAPVIAATGGAAPLPLLGGWAVETEVRIAAGLADLPGVAGVWYLHPDLADVYVGIIGALGRLTLPDRPKPAVANISLGPPARLMPMRIWPDEPMSRATENAARQGVVPVLAVGNFGAPDGTRDGWVNPWSLPEWVISVGAGSEDGRTLWDRSSRGDPADPETWPDVIAHGVDSIGAWPTGVEKSAARRARDESHPVFLARVPPEQRGLYTIDTGTSFAAPVVTGAASQIAHFVQGAIARAGAREPGARLFELTMTRAKWERSLRRPRLTGGMVDGRGGEVVVRYGIDTPWRLIKQLLIDTAIDMPGYAMHEVGAGFVSRSLVDAQFGAFGLVQPAVTGEKVVET